MRERVLAVMYRSSLLFLWPWALGKWVDGWLGTPFPFLSVRDKRISSTQEIVTPISPLPCLFRKQHCSVISLSLSWTLSYWKEDTSHMIDVKKVNVALRLPPRYLFDHWMYFMYTLDQDHQDMNSRVFPAPWTLGIYNLGAPYKATSSTFWLK